MEKLSVLSKGRQKDRNTIIIKSFEKKCVENCFGTYLVQQCIRNNECKWRGTKCPWINSEGGNNVINILLVGSVNYEKRFTCHTCKKFPTHSATQSHIRMLALEMKMLM